VVKVALASAPGVLADLLETIIERDAEFHLTARTEDLGGIGRLVRDTEPDAVILCGEPTSTSLLAPRLLSAGKCSAVATISPDGKDVSLFAPRRRPVRLGDPSPDQLLSRIQETVSRHAEGDDA
jgi:hypothetical protein